MHIGEAAIDAVGADGEFFVIEAEQVQERGIEVMHVDGIAHDVEAVARSAG